MGIILPKEIGIKKQRKSGEVVITAPYKSSTTGNIVITIAKQNEDKSGVLGIDLIINDIVNTSKWSISVKRICSNLRPI